MSCELYQGVSRPIDAFIKYFLDVKPYHTKILEILEKYRFSEEIVVSILETIDKKITIANDPLCKVTGWGVDWDNDCGFDALNCCDLFDCIGGYGLIFDNSTLVASANILSSDTILDKIVVKGNKTHDTKLQITGISTTTSCTVLGNQVSLFQPGTVFLVIPKHTFNIVKVLKNGFVVAGNVAGEFTTKGTFLVYNSSGNDRVYTTKEAGYDFSSNSTTVLVNEELKNPESGLGTIEINSNNKNNGIYQVQSSSFNGLTTYIQVKSSVKTFNILNDSTHGTIQLRTGFLYPRFLTLEKNTSSPNVPYPPSDDFKIMQSNYDYGSDTTEISFMKPLRESYTGGTAKLFGYMTNPGFDADPECSAPKPMNIHAQFSEYLKIEIINQPTGNG